MGKDEFVDFVLSASKEELTMLLEGLKGKIGFDRICNTLQELITLY